MPSDADDPSPGERRAGVTLLVATLAVIVTIVGWPNTGTFVDPSLRWLADVTGWDFRSVERLANVALFVPLGAAGAVAVGPRRRWWVVGAAGALSVAVEAAQGLLLPGRHPTLTDVVTNTAGAAVGVLAVAAVQARRARR